MLIVHFLRHSWHSHDIEIVQARGVRGRDRLTDEHQVMLARQGSFCLVRLTFILLSRELSGVDMGSVCFCVC